MTVYITRNGYDLYLSVKANIKTLRVQGFGVFAS